MEFHTAAETLVNNGHTLQVTVDDEDDFLLDSGTFHLRQYHFHAPSKSRIQGRAFPLEAHFVHQNAAGELVVVTMMFELGAENPALTDILARLPAQRFSFSRSLMTWLYTEELRWLVMKQLVQLSQDQLNIFRKAPEVERQSPPAAIVWLPNGRIMMVACWA